MLCWFGIQMTAKWICFERNFELFIRIASTQVIVKVKMVQSGSFQSEINPKLEWNTLKHIDSPINLREYETSNENCSPLCVSVVICLKSFSSHICDYVNCEIRCQYWQNEWGWTIFFLSKFTTIYLILECKRVILILFLVFTWSNEILRSITFCG